MKRLFLMLILLTGITAMFRAFVIMEAPFSEILLESSLIALLLGIPTILCFYDKILLSFRNFCLWVSSFGICSALKLPILYYCTNVLGIWSVCSDAGMSHGSAWEFSAISALFFVPLWALGGSLSWCACDLGEFRSRSKSGEN